MKEPQEIDIDTIHIVLQKQMKCATCSFANDKAIGKNEPCCTYPEQLHLKGTKCFSRKEKDKI